MRTVSVCAVMAVASFCAALAVLSLAGCSDPAQQAKVHAGVTAACEADKAAVPAVDALAPLAGPQAAALGAVDAAAVHPLVQNALCPGAEAATAAKP